MALPTGLFGAARLLGAAVGKAAGVQPALAGGLSNRYAGWRPLEF